MTDEQRLQKITEMLLLVRDNLFKGMSKSLQKLQARSINEILELPNYTSSPQHKPLTEGEIATVMESFEAAYQKHPKEEKLFPTSRDDHQINRLG